MTVRTVTPMPPERAAMKSQEDAQRARVGLIGALQGKTNNVGDVSLPTDGVTTTTDIVEPTITASSFIGLSALDAGGATELGLGIAISYPAVQTARLTHTASATTRTLRYVVIG